MRQNTEIFARKGHLPILPLRLVSVKVGKFVMVVRGDLDILFS